MTGKKLEIISQIVLWYENSFRIDWNAHDYKCRVESNFLEPTSSECPRKCCFYERLWILIPMTVQWNPLYTILSLVQTKGTVSTGFLFLKGLFIEETRFGTTGHHGYSKNKKNAKTNRRGDKRRMKFQWPCWKIYRELISVVLYYRVKVKARVRVRALWSVKLRQILRLP